MNLCMIKSCVKHAALFVGAALNSYPAKCFCPYVMRLAFYTGKVTSWLFGIKILSGIGYTYKRNANLHLYLLAFLKVERHKISNVIACHIATIVVVYLVLSAIHIPIFCSTLKLGLLFPVATLLWSFAHTHNKIHRKYSLRIVTESAKQTHTLKLG